MFLFFLKGLLLLIDILKGAVIIFLFLLMRTLSLLFSRGLTMLSVYFYKCWSQPKSKPYKYTIAKRKFLGCLDKNKKKGNVIGPPYITKVDFCLLLKNFMWLSPGPLLRYHDAYLDNAAKFANAKPILLSNQLLKKIPHRCLKLRK